MAGICMHMTNTFSQPLLDGGYIYIYSQAFYAVAFSVMTDLDMLTAGTHVQ